MSNHGRYTCAKELRSALDLRGASDDVLESIKKQAFRLHKQGLGVCKIAYTLGVARTTVTNWVRDFRGKFYEDEVNFRPKKRGIKEGEQTRLSPEKQAIFKEIISGKSPDMLGYSESHWTVNLMRDFVKKSFDVEYSSSGMALLAKRIGLSCQIPKKRDYRACSEARSQWLKRVSKIEEHAKQSKADVMYFDACSVHPEGTKVKSWGKKGQAPVVNHKLSKNRINVLCAISQDGSMIYTRTKLNINSDQFISFLQKILDSKPKKKIFLILDNASPHKSKKTKDFLNKHKRLRLFFTHIPT